MRLTGTRRTLLAVSAGGALLVAGTGLIAVLEGVVGVDDASASYLLPVLAMAALFGVAAGIATSFGAFLLYDFFFVEPRFTLTISDAGESLNLVLLVMVGAIVGLLASALRSRAEVAWWARHRHRIARPFVEPIWIRRRARLARGPRRNCRLPLVVRASRLASGSVAPGVVPCCVGWASVRHGCRSGAPHRVR